MTEKIDVNKCMRVAEQLFAVGDYSSAIKIYLFLADGDPSLDGGYLGMKLGEAYEAAGDIHAAKYWHGRAVEENPEVRLMSVEALKRLKDVTLKGIVD